MIIGIGSDLIDIRRVEKSIERFAERFTHRCFTDIERAKLPNPIIALMPAHSCDLSRLVRKPTIVVARVHL